jgi:hypothetical protein
MKSDEYLDVLDSTNSWCVAILKKLDEAKGEVSVHFEAWSNRYDEVSP